MIKKYMQFYCNNKYNLAYLPIRKVASTSMLSYLAKMKIGQSMKPKRFFEEDRQKLYFDLVTNNEDVIKQYYKFSIVRNPYTRLESFYKDIIIRKMENDNRLKLYKQLGLSCGVTFEEFVDNFIDIPYSQLDGHGVPQTNYLFDGNIMRVQFIAKIENLIPDLKQIFENMGITNYPSLALLEHRNKTQCQDINFSDETRSKIYHYYRNDFELLNYPY